jgi:hypothetical protein
MTFKDLPDKVYANYVYEVHGLGKKKKDITLCERMAFYMELNSTLVETLETTSINDLIANIYMPTQTTTQTGGLVRKQTFLDPGGQFDVPAGYCLDDLVVLSSTSDRTIKIGTTSGGEEIMSEIEIEAGEIFSFRKIYYFGTSATMYVTVDATSTIIFYFKPLVA